MRLGHHLPLIQKSDADAIRRPRRGLRPQSRSGSGRRCRVAAPRARSRRPADRAPAWPLSRPTPGVEEGDVKAAGWYVINTLACGVGHARRACSPRRRRPPAKPDRCRARPRSCPFCNLAAECAVWPGGRVAGKSAGRIGNSLALELASADEEDVGYSWPPIEHLWPRRARTRQ